MNLSSNQSLFSVTRTRNSLFTIALTTSFVLSASAAINERWTHLAATSSHGALDISLRYQTDGEVKLSLYRKSDPRKKPVSISKPDIFTRIYEIGSVNLGKHGTGFVWASSETGQLPETYLWRIEPKGNRLKVLARLTSPQLKFISKGELTEQCVARWEDHPPPGTEVDTQVTRLWKYSEKENRFLPEKWKRRAKKRS